MKLRFTFALLLGTLTATYAQVEEKIIVVQEEAEPAYSYDFSFFEPTELDTVVKYRTQTFPFIAGGFGNVSDDGAFANSDFGYLRSGFFEWGLAFRRPFNEDKNLLGLRYGVSFSYNSITPTQNNILYDNGNGETF